MTTPPRQPAEVEPTIHEAERASGPSGAVEWGPELTVEEAIQRRRQGGDIVVRGPVSKRNRATARKIEEAVGTPVIEDQPHAKAGPFALPHFHQESHDPDGHTFYEGWGRTAKRKKAKGKKAKGKK
jgi:hypothetical protein